MRQGTISVLFGCHSPVHSLMVLIAWIKLYKRPPNWWQIICIFIHDIGHWGKDYLDDYEEKKHHADLGAKIAKTLFGQKGYDLIAGHNVYDGDIRSELHDPDKYSWVIAPVWWLLTNHIFEPKLIRKGSSRLESCKIWKEAMRKNMETGFKKLGHEIYMEQWGHYDKTNITT